MSLAVKAVYREWQYHKIDMRSIDGSFSYRYIAMAPGGRNIITQKTFEQKYSIEDFVMECRPF